jgi:hypothetical protein
LRPSVASFRDSICALPATLVNAYLICYLIIYQAVDGRSEIGQQMADIESKQEASSATTIKKDRSPSFPFITLTKAIDRTRELYTAARRHEMRLPDAAKAMGYGAKSSGAIQTLAALIAFGLVEDQGSGEGRKFRVSELGFKALEDQRPGAREAALAEAAMMPKLIDEYAAHWSEGRPDDPICISALRFDKSFTEDGAKAFLRVFDDAVGYAKVSGQGKPSAAAASSAATATPLELSVGDIVRVEAGGQVVFDKTRVRAIDGPWVFVDASQSGAKISDVTLIEKSSTQGDVPPPVLPFERNQDAKPDAGEEMDQFTVDEGIVKIIFPTGMTADSVEELEQFLALFIKKAKRRAAAEK